MKNFVFIKRLFSNQTDENGFRCKLDRREGRCYMEVEDRGGQRRCHHEMGSAVSKATCCCSVGKAWGPKCESCPGVDTEEYKTLCPGGTGYRPNPSTVSVTWHGDRCFASVRFILSLC